MSSPFNFYDSIVHRPVMFATLGFGLGALTLALVNWFTDYITNREKISSVRGVRRTSCPSINIENAVQTDSVPVLRPSRSESQLFSPKENATSLSTNVSVFPTSESSSSNGTRSIGTLVRPEELDAFQGQGSSNLYANYFKINCTRFFIKIFFN